MAKCNCCGTETELYDAGLPICPDCVEERDPQARPEATDYPGKRACNGKPTTPRTASDPRDCPSVMSSRPGV